MLGGLLLLGTTACSSADTKYFKNRVNEATALQVVEKYGTPHKVEQVDGGRTVWTYFERGSATVGYSGVSRGGACRAYRLTFDQEDFLRDWKVVDC